MKAVKCAQANKRKTVKVSDVDRAGECFHQMPGCESFESHFSRWDNDGFASFLRYVSRHVHDFIPYDLGQLLTWAL
jgi:transposase-like protein